MKAQLERLFGKWSTPAPFTRVPRPLIVKRPVATPIETPDKANAFLTGQTSFAMSDKDPDYPAMLLADYIFGGSTNSRLWLRIRQKDGLSYGIGTALRASSFEQNTSMVVNAIFAPENLPRLRSGVREEVERVLRDGFQGEEVADGKRALLQERRLARSQDATLAATLVEQAYVGRTFAYSGEVDRAIEALTPQQVTDTFRRRVKADAFAFVFAGDFAKGRKESAAAAPR